MTVVTTETDMLHEVAARFLPAGVRAEIQAFGNGNIHKTYLVTPADGSPPLLLQRMNTWVFQQPELVMRNMGIVSRHLQQLPAGPRRWESPHVLETHEGLDHFRAEDGSCWRAQRFIRRSKTVEVIQDVATAHEVGHALGTFHAQLRDLPVDALADTLPGFHIAPGYLARYDALSPRALTPDEQWCADFIAAHRGWVPQLEDALASGLLQLRPIHGDPKVNNILFDAETGDAIAVIDWDTIKPGLVHYDIGDCLRSSCNPDGEETERWQDVRFDLALGRAVLEGYLGQARGFFTPADFDFVPASARLIAFELGLRFFTDHLEGDAYFRVERPGQNLARALVQFALARSIDEHFDELTHIVQGLR